MPTDPKLVDLLIAWEELHDQGQEVAVEELCRTCPELLEPLKERIQAIHKVAWMKKAASVDVPEPQTQEAVPVRTLAGRYRLDKLIGEGGFGQVWRGFDLELHRSVAVKISRRGRLARPDDAKA